MLGAEREREREREREIAVVVPIYPPHFKRARTLLKSFLKFHFEEQANLYFVFTNREESDTFGQYKYKIILPENFEYQKEGIINVKKLYAINKLYKKYEFILVLDAESKFIKTTNLNAIFSDFFDKKILYGNSTIADLQNILYACKEFFIDKNTLSKYDNLYLWYNQPCIYKSSNIEKFFHEIKISNNFHKITFFHFDYYMYMYYLILHEKFNVFDLGVESVCGLFESTTKITQEKNKKLSNIYPLLGTRYIYKKLNNNKIFLQIHIDRTERINFRLNLYEWRSRIFKYIFRNKKTQEYIKNILRKRLS